MKLRTWYKLEWGLYQYAEEITPCGTRAKFYFKSVGRKLNNDWFDICPNDYEYEVPLVERILMGLDEL